MKQGIPILICVFLTASCSVSRKIIDRPIVFDEERMQLTRDYQLEHYGLQQESIAMEPKMIVLHWTAIPTLEGSYDAFLNSKIPTSRADIQLAGALNVSTHFLVDRDGTIYQLMPETYMGRHVIGLNHSAIGIENVGGTANTPLTEAQLKANLYLIKYLAKKYKIDYLIGHYEYPLFVGHSLWLEQDEGYRTTKKDPGTDFMLKIREATKKLKFKALPQEQ